MDMDRKKAGCGTFIISWVIVTVVFAAFLMVINETGQSVGSIVSSSVGIGFLVAFAIMAFRMVKLTSKGSKEERKQREKDKQEGIGRYNSVIHVGGLAAPENCKASVMLSPTTLTVNCGGSEYALNIEKIRNVDFQLDVNETQYLKSSFAKGVVGAAVFGMPGAIIGSAPKTKTKRNVKCYAIISYEDAQGEYRTFLLRDEVANTRVCAGLVDALRPRINQQINRIEL